MELLYIFFVFWLVLWLTAGYFHYVRDVPASEKHFRMIGFVLCIYAVAVLFSVAPL